MARLFGTDGIRGVANRDIPVDLALKVAQAAALVLGKDSRDNGLKPKAVIARDPRISGEFLVAAVSAGLAASGVDVFDAGVIPTPAAAYLTADLDADFGVMISASHNPAADNGIKIFARGGHKLPDQIEDAIEKAINEEKLAPIGGAVGHVTRFADAEDRYIVHLMRSVPNRLDGLKIVLDCANGAASAVSPEIFADLGAEVIVIGADPDGLNINEGCGSTHLTALQTAVIEHKADNLGHSQAIAPALDAIAPLLEVPGVFVNGSNDYYAPGFRNPFNYLLKPSTPMPGKPLDTKALNLAFEKNWLNLNNRSGTLNIKGTTIGFAGLDDPHDQLADYDGISLPTGTDVLIGVAHAPYRKVIDELGGCALIFAGHTHGGQVCLPGGRAIVTNCDLPAKNARGLSGWQTPKGQTFLNVCAGLGTSIFAPVRLFCRPEVRLLTLLPKN